ncbi:hypothetical protein WA158_004023 [Blastocystis sp. Blastoise]
MCYINEHEEYLYAILELKSIENDDTLGDDEKLESLSSCMKKHIKLIMSSSDIEDSEKISIIQHLLFYQSELNEEIFPEGDEYDDEDEYEYDDEDNDEDNDDEYLSDSSTDEYLEFTEDMVRYNDKEEHRLGCKHGSRGCSIFCSECKEWFACAECHDIAKDHIFDIYNVKYMACMYCLHVQEPSQYCEKCGEKLGDYYCDICHFWVNNKSIYHCPHCKMCRVGEGLNIDHYHCMKCDSCQPIEYEEIHECLENAAHANCPICQQEMLYSMNSCVTMNCGHRFHDECLDHFIFKSDGKCPICKKYMLCPKILYNKIDTILENPMCSELQKWKTEIRCNDCDETDYVPFHFNIYKCSNRECGSFNTKRIGGFFEPAERIKKDFLFDYLDMVSFYRRNLLNRLLVLSRQLNYLFSDDDDNTSEDNLLEDDDNTSEEDDDNNTSKEENLLEDDDNTSEEDDDNNTSKEENLLKEDDDDTSKEENLLKEENYTSEEDDDDNTSEEENLLEEDDDNTSEEDDDTSKEEDYSNAKIMILNVTISIHQDNN